MFLKLFNIKIAEILLLFQPLHMEQILLYFDLLKEKKKIYLFFSKNPLKFRGTVHISTRCLR